MEEQQAAAVVVEEASVEEARGAMVPVVVAAAQYVVALGGWSGMLTRTRGGGIGKRRRWRRWPWLVWRARCISGEGEWGGVAGAEATLAGLSGGGTVEAAGGQPAASSREGG